MIALIDNYDSFTFNLVQYLEILKQDVRVFLHDEMSAEDVISLNPQHILLSPGPGNPSNAGISLELIKKVNGKIPILGVCLGHQCIAEAYGAKIVQAPEIIHGKTSKLTHAGLRLFRDLPQHFKVTRYHSLCIEPSSLPDCFHIDAYTDTTIMAISHRKHPIYGVQFHPEAILSEYGLELLNNFLTI